MALFRNARLLRRQIMHQYIYTKGEKNNLYFLFEQIKDILLDRDFLAPTYKLTMHLADKKVFSIYKPENIISITTYL